jgi:hypothetical protein
MAGKLGGRGRLNAVVPGLLVHIIDQLSGRRYLVDTGASFSIFPHKSTTPPSGQKLTGSDGQLIPCWGEKRIVLVFHACRFAWTFLLADVQFPIIGVDFLQQNRLLVDPAANRLVDTLSFESFPTVTELSSAVSAAGGPAVAPVFKRVLDQFPEVVNPEKRLPPKTKHGVEHHIRVKQRPPISSKLRRLDPVKFAATKAEFDQLERDGIIHRSDSPWASPLHMVKKADGSWRHCGDYRRLNLITIPDAYLQPNMMDFAARMSGCTIFSKVDLRKGYHQIHMHTNDICKTAIITPFGLYEYLRMGFGLHNARNTFQRMMDRVASGMPFVFVYLDDIIVSSRDVQSHVRHLHLLFKRLRDQGLVINGEKCKFGAQELDFLGHRVSAAGVAPLRKKVEAILAHPRPGSLQELQGFLGTVNFYRRFLPAAAKLLRLLTDALRGGKEARERIEWSAEMEEAFSATKQALAKATLLAHPSPGAEVALMVDASGYHVGAALQKRTSAAGA